MDEWTDCLVRWINKWIKIWMNKQLDKDKLTTFSLFCTDLSVQITLIVLPTPISSMLVISLGGISLTPDCSKA